jgi:hypothetical protein
VSPWLAPPLSYAKLASCQEAENPGFVCFDGVWFEAIIPS